jgi:spore coat polysaccharide biosynthesis protein SpsF (cytidylyltransferase family)
MNINENEKEHVTLGIYQRPNTFKIENFQNEINLGDHRWTVDYEEDFSLNGAYVYQAIKVAPVAEAIM